MKIINTFILLCSLISQISFATSSSDQQNLYIIKLKDLCEPTYLLSQNELNLVEQFSHLPSLFLAKLPESYLPSQFNFSAFLDRHQCIDFIEPNILIAEVDHVPTHQLAPANAQNKFIIPNDEQINSQWYLAEKSVDHSGISAFQAWDIFTNAQDQIIAIIDSGVDINHSDLKDNIWKNFGETGIDQNGNDRSTNGIDDDGNGFIDDVYGWNFVENNNNVSDQKSHGTHCAGIAGASGNNFVGIAGVSWKTQIMPVKFIASNGFGSLDTAIKAIVYAVDNGATTISASWGTTSQMQSMKEALEYANSKGVLFVTAAGNEKSNIDVNHFYPASFNLPNMITVGASNEKDELAGFSSYGPQTVVIAAPGTNIFSTLPSEKYGIKNGTSMATPIVAGAVALLRSYYKNFSYLEIKDLLIKSSDPIFGLDGKVNGARRLNLLNALKEIFPQPDWPQQDSDWLLQSFNLSTPHPIVGKSDVSWTIKHPGAKYIKIHFSKIDLTNAYDLIYIYNAQNQQIKLIGGPLVSNSVWSDTIEGDTVRVRFRSQLDQTRYGFDIDQYTIPRHND